MCVCVRARVCMGARVCMRVCMCVCGGGGGGCQAPGMQYSSNRNAAAWALAVWLLLLYMRDGPVSAPVQLWLNHYHQTWAAWR